MQIPSHPVPLLVDSDLLHPLVEPGILDGDPGRDGQRADERLVVLGEL